MRLVCIIDTFDGGNDYWVSLAMQEEGLKDEKTSFLW